MNNSYSPDHRLRQMIAGHIPLAVLTRRRERARQIADQRIRQSQLAGIGRSDRVVGLRQQFLQVHRFLLPLALQNIDPVERLRQLLFFGDLLGGASVNPLQLQLATTLVVGVVRETGRVDAPAVAATECQIAAGSAVLPCLTCINY